MKKLFRQVIFLFLFGFSGIQHINSQCLFISCPPDTTVTTTAGLCGAAVNYIEPIGVELCSDIQDTFYFTGAMQYFVVPPGVDSVTAYVYGSQGGANWVSNTNFGGMARGDIAVSPGDSLFIYVGEQPTGLTGGWNGGGNGESAGKGGGGASDIRMGGKTLNDRIIVAGGGGGAGYWSSQHVEGGVGGGLTGGPGQRGPSSPGGQGGTQTSSGTGTCVSLNNPICSGGFGYGGAPSSCGCEGYGGGGGWYGGAGSGNCRGGGGGSGYLATSIVNGSFMSGVQVGHGIVVIEYPNAMAGGTTMLASGIGSSGFFPKGINVETYIVYNTTGDTASCTMNVEVVDMEPPVIECPEDFFTEDLVINGIAPVSVTDNCTTTSVHYRIEGASSGGGLNDASGSTFLVGISNVWYIVTDAAGNKDSCSFEIAVRPVGVEESMNSSEITIYPNPGDGNFTMRFESSLKTKADMTVYDMTGQIVYVGTCVTGNIQKLNLSHLEKGVYFVKVDDAVLKTPVIIH